MYVRNRPSVRNEVSQSFFLFFFYFILVSMYGSPHVMEHECHGWTDKFQLFSLSVAVRMSRMDRQAQLFPVQFQFSRIK
jgi:hypothetical protein